MQRYACLETLNHPRSGSRFLSPRDQIFHLSFAKLWLYALSDFFCHCDSNNHESDSLRSSVFCTHVFDNLKLSCYFYNWNVGNVYVEKDVYLFKWGYISINVIATKMPLLLNELLLLKKCGVSFKAICFLFLFCMPEWYTCLHYFDKSFHWSKRALQPASLRPIGTNFSEIWIKIIHNTLTLM